MILSASIISWYSLMLLGLDIQRTITDLRGFTSLKDRDVEKTLPQALEILYQFLLPDSKDE